MNRHFCCWPITEDIVNYYLGKRVISGIPYNQEGTPDITPHSLFHESRTSVPEGVIVVLHTTHNTYLCAVKYVPEYLELTGPAWNICEAGASPHHEAPLKLLGNHDIVVSSGLRGTRSWTPLCLEAGTFQVVDDYYSSRLHSFNLCNIFVCSCSVVHQWLMVLSKCWIVVFPVDSNFSKKNFIISEMRLQVINILI